jgi:CRISPR/Cas system CMR-associated protein Cmr3 (group 5 of RAMP superfamily)
MFGSFATANLSRAGEDHAAETLFPPSPFTLQGAIRTKVLADKGVNLAEFAKNGERNPDPDVGYGENFGSCVCADRF